MTKAELIKALEQANDDAEISVSIDGGREDIQRLAENEDHYLFLLKEVTHCGDGCHAFLVLGNVAST